MSASPLNPIAIVHKANQRAPLSPGQRAFLKVMKQVGYFLLTTALTQSPQIAQLISGKSPSLATAFVAQVVAGVLQILASGFDKYMSAQGDANYTLVRNSVLETLYRVFRQSSASGISGASNPPSDPSASAASSAVPTEPVNPNSSGSASVATVNPTILNSTAGTNDYTLSQVIVH